MPSGPTLKPRHVFARAYQMAEKLGAPRSEERYIHGSGDVAITVEVDGDTYVRVVTERGQESERRATRDLDEFLFWMISGTVFDMASAHELAHRIAGQDSRRLLFAKKIELFARLGPDWAKRAVEHTNAILANHPFMDDLEPRFLSAPV